MYSMTSPLRLYFYVLPFLVAPTRGDSFTHTTYRKPSLILPLEDLVLSTLLASP